MVQSVEPPTLDFGSGYDPRIAGSNLALGFMLSVETAEESLLMSSLARTFQNGEKKKKKSGESVNLSLSKVH